MHLWAKSGSPIVKRNIALSYESARQLIIPFRSPVARSEIIDYDLEFPLKVQLPLPISHISKFKPWELMVEDDLFEQNSDFA